MTEEMRNDLTPQGYIRQMFRETADGKLAITYYPFAGEPETRTYEVNWTAEDAEQIVSRYILLTNALVRIGRLHDKMEDNADWYRLLEEADLEVWNTYVQPYEPMEVNWDELYPIPPCAPDELMSLIHEIHERGRYGDLIEEEDMVVTMTHFGYVKRLPVNTYRTQHRGGRGVADGTSGGRSGVF